MVKATVNWESPETWERMVASIIASGVKMDMRSVALYFGTTYDTVENRFRKIKKEAEVLKQEIKAGKRGEVAPARTTAKSDLPTPRKPKTPRKDVLGVVANGKVSKTTTPRKKRAIKHEEDAEGESDNYGLESVNPSFDRSTIFNYSFSGVGDEDDLLV